MPAPIVAGNATMTRPTFIQVGPGMLWTNVDKPANGAILAVSGHLATSTVDQRIYGPVPCTTSGSFVGSTIGDSSIAYRCTFVDIQIETSTAKVEKVLNTEEARCNFSMAELTTLNIQKSLPGHPDLTPVATYTTGAVAGTASYVAQTIKVGGLRLVHPQCIAFISPHRRISLASGQNIANQPCSYVFCGYNAVSTEGFEAPFSRGRETVWRCSFEMIADTARDIGDQLFQFTTNVPAAHLVAA